MEVVFRCLLKKNKNKQSRHGRKELLREGKKKGGGGEQKYSHSLQIRLMKNTKITRSWERERATAHKNVCITWYLPQTKEKQKIPT